MLLELYQDNAIVGRHIRLQERKSKGKSNSALSSRIVPILVWSLPLSLVSLQVLSDKHPLLPQLLLGSLGTSGTFALLCLAIRGIQATASSITQEREQKTFESLTSTLMSPFEIVTGKLWIAAAPLLQECLETLPLLAVLAIAGGQPSLIPLLLVLQILTILFSTTLGMTVSYLTRNSQEAGRIGGLLILTWSLLPMMINSAVDQVAGTELHVNTFSPLGVWGLAEVRHFDLIGQSGVAACVAALAALLIHLQRRAMTERTR